jgi:hypothetical protein
MVLYNKRDTRRLGFQTFFFVAKQTQFILKHPEALHRESLSSKSFQSQASLVNCEQAS